MGMPAIDLTGKVFGYLTVLHRAPHTAQNRAHWLCQCVCGRQVVRQSQSLREKRRPNAKHCGCRHKLINVRHHMSYTRPYRIWIHMRRRCTDPKFKDYPNYGGRGITVCAQWLESFDNFWADMCLGYSDLLSLGRKDNSQGYCPDNCRWETQTQQARNTRSNVWIVTPRGRMTVADAADAYNISRYTIYGRLKSGWSDIAAVMTPVR